MDQRELVRTGSDGKPDKFMIVLVMHLNDPTNLMAESQVFKSIVIDWFRTRGATAESVQLSALSDPLYHGAIKELFEVLHAGEISLRPVFKEIPLRIALHDPKGTLLTESELPPITEEERGSVLSRLMKKFKSGA
jgi:hypothetical protein